MTKQSLVLEDEIIISTIRVIIKFRYNLVHLPLGNMNGKLYIDENQSRKGVIKIKFILFFFNQNSIS